MWPLVLLTLLKASPVLFFSAFLAINSSSAQTKWTQWLSRQFVSCSLLREISVYIYIYTNFFVRNLCYVYTTVFVPALLDDLDKELNNYNMRCREWYGWHFPELGKIITDNFAYVRTVKAIGEYVPAVVFHLIVHERVATQDCEKT